MNKLLAQITLFIVATMLLSSCSKQLHMSLTKRHYRSGYYVNFGAKNHTQIPAITSRSIKRAKHQAAIKPDNLTVINTSIVTEEKPRLHLNKIEQKKRKAIDDNRKEYISSNQHSFTSIILPDNSLNNKTTNDHHVQVNVDVSFVVIILCAIFIPPLGVGLMYGINSYFWIDLILTLLFFIPGMIFALVVVLM
jgi:uncharacterized membrane protein YqaE (UPF0057 family)